MPIPGPGGPTSSASAAERARQQAAEAARRAAEEAARRAAEEAARRAAEEAARRAAEQAAREASEARAKAAAQHFQDHAPALEAPQGDKASPHRSSRLNLLQKAGHAVAKTAEAGLDQVQEAAKDAGEAVSSTAQKGLDALQGAGKAVVSETKEGLDALQEAGEAAVAKTKDGLDAAKNSLGKLEDKAWEALGPVADHVLGRQEKAFRDQIDGALGLVTNRLAPGESLYINGSVGGTVGVAAYGQLNVSGGAVLARNGDGTLSLSVNVEPRVDGGVSAKTGAESDNQLGQHSLDVGAKADASAEAQVGGKGTLTLKFDPKKEKDVAQLKDLLEPKALDAVTNPLSALCLKPAALATCADSHFDSLQTQGEVGTEASANASAGVAAASADAGVSASGSAGVVKKVRRDGGQEHTYFLKGDAGHSEGVSAGTASVSQTGTVKGGLALTLKEDADGKLTGVVGEYGISGSESLKVKSSAKGAVSASQTVKNVETLTSAGLKVFEKHRAKGDSLLEAYSKARRGEEAVVLREVTTSTEEVNVSSKNNVALFGAQVGLEISGAIGKTKQTSKVVDEPTALDFELFMENRR